MDIEDRELTKEQQRKLKIIAKSINSLVADIRKTYPMATIYATDGGGLNVFELPQAYCELGDQQILGRVNCDINGGAY